jgi:ABC-type sugar transport system, periplasmic component
MIKKLSIFITMILCILLLTSCDKTKKEVIEGTSVNEYNGMTIIEELGMKNVFSDTSINLKDYRYLFSQTSNNFIDFYSRFFVMNGRIYIAANKIIDKENLDNTTLVLHSYDANGENVQELEVHPVIENAVVRHMWYDSEYNQIIIDELEYKYTLHKINQSGEIVFSIPLDISDYIVSMAIGENDNIYIGTSNKITVFTKDGEKICELSLDNELIQIVSAHGKRPMLKFNYTQGYEIYAKYSYINVEQQKLEDIEIPVNTNLSIYHSYMFYGEGYDYYYMDNIGVYGYDIATNTLTKVLDWMNSDITFSEMCALTVISADKMAAISMDSASYTYNFSILNRIPDDQIPEKTYLSIGYISQYEDKYFNTVVSSFNKSSDKYRLTLKNYYSPYDELDPILRLNNDIAAGNIPDLLYINSYAPVLKYSKNNLFADLNDYLTNDKTLADNLLPFITGSTMINNKLTQMVTKFNVNTIIGKTKNISDKESWSYRDMIDMYNSLSSESKMFWDYYNRFAQLYMIDNVILECVDYDNATCDFNTPGFRDYLELFKSMPETFDIDVPYDEVPYKCRDDEYYLNANAYIFSIAYFYEDIVKYFRDEEVTIIGYPTADGQKRADIIDSSGFSIFNSSANKDAAWEFIKYCLSDEFSKYSTAIGGFIPTRSAISISSNEYLDVYYYIRDENLTSIGGDAPIENPEEKYGTGVELHISEEKVNEFNSYIESLDHYVYTDDNILDIVYQEMSNFYNNNISVDNTINAIQSRVSIYMKEVWG